MRVLIAAVGRLRGGPEAELTADYLQRATSAGKPAALGPFELAEVEAGTSGDAAREADLLLKAVPKGAVRVVLDERGAPWTSRAFAERLARWRDQGVPAVAFLIGGPNGLAERVRAEADATLAFGPQTWPHRLVRVMLAEQLYRAVTIETGSPYHRD
ncbi:MAG: 23S rRNA (pseudouridine(1915)-N(3))-methyltransferase RlmH [Alphaproteobacteria bacterium]|nr:23S rRNA (pseudouridine(1915)-N(3))-methyltransferase RlmH [Alphaproteobacteria bacterium]